MWPVAISVMHSVVSMSVLGTPRSPAETDEPIDMPYWGTLEWAKELCVRWDPDPHWKGNFREKRTRLS